LEIKEFFDLYWKRKDFRRFDRYYDFLKGVNSDVFDKLSVFENKKILAIGIGDTKDIEYLKRLGGDVISIDISSNALKADDRIHRIQMDANEMGFKEDSFDTVFMRTVLLHLHHRKALLEIKRILHKGGRFFWIEPMKNNFFLWLYRFILSSGRFTKTDYLTYKEVQSFNRFFKNIYHREYFFVTVIFYPISVLFPGTQNLIQKFVGIEKRIVDRFKWLKRFCWFSYGYGEI